MLFRSKATAVSGALIVAGALVTSSVQSTDAALDAAGPDPVAAVFVSSAPPATPTRPALSSPRPEAPAAPMSAGAAPAPAVCAADPQVRDASLQTIRSAFANAHSALDRLGSDRTGIRAAETLGRAGTMLANVDRTAEDLVATAGSCAADAREITDRAVHAMEMIVDLAQSATAPTPTPRPTRKPEPTKKHH